MPTFSELFFTAAFIAAIYALVWIVAHNGEPDDGNF